MFGVDSGELFIIVLVAVVVIGPKELPRVMRTVGGWAGRARAMANQFRSGIDQMVRESEIADLERKWREQNEAIMRATSDQPADSGWGLDPVDAPLSLEKKSLEKKPDVLEAAPVPPPLPAPDPLPAYIPPTLDGKRRRPVAPKLVKPAGAAPRTGAP